MKTLSEIRRNLIAFYTSIQNKITDFSPGSVINGIFFSFSASLERLYRLVDDVTRQAYIATATGEYLDRLIDGTFQLKRRAATRSTGYVVVYANSPIVDYEGLEFKYAEFDRETGEFTGGTQSATKFVGYNVQGEEGIVYSLINPVNPDALLPNIDPTSSERLIYLDRPVQFLVLPVASMSTGRKTNVREGGIYSFPNPPAGIAGVLNTSNPGAVFFSSRQAVTGVPFYSRFTEISGYSNTNNTFKVLNAFNFSNTGFIEITGNSTNEKLITAVYTDGQVTRSAGLIWEYIQTSTTSITLTLPIHNSEDKLPEMTVLEGGTVRTLPLESVQFDGQTTQITSSEDLLVFIQNIIQTEGGLRVQQRPDQISPDLIYDPDNVLTSEYTLIESARVGGGTNEDTDAEYRAALRAYLAGLARATDPALEAGTLQIPGVTYAKTLPSAMTPRGTALILASDDSGVLPAGMRSRIKATLEEEWAAAGVSVIVQQPELINLNATLTIRLAIGTSPTTVNQQVLATIDEYLKSLPPGGVLRYSDILTAIREIGGVVNVFNLILSKHLTDESYVEHKASYDEQVLEHVSGTGLTNFDLDGAFTVADAGKMIKYNSSQTPRYVITTDPDEAVGIIYLVDEVNNTYEVLEGNASVLYNLYQELVVNEDATTVDYFKNVLVNNIEFFGSTLQEQMFFLSYVLGEPIEELSPENYPMDPEYVNYSSIRDYQATEVEIFRPSIADIGTSTTPLIGVKFI